MMQTRFICTCASLQASKMQLGRIVNKVLSSDRTKRMRNKEASTGNPVQTAFHLSTKKIPSANVTHRVTALNKIFMKHITDLMSSGEVAPELLNRGIEVSHVKVANDFSCINVYWYAENEKDINNTTENLLKKAAGHLQHEMSQLRVIGVVPPICFVKNKKYYVIREVENRLETIDFGEDYIPTAYIKTRVQVPTLETSLPPEIKAKISEVEQSSQELEGEEEEIYEIEIPEMRQDVMGFDHSAIIKKVRQALNKSKIAKERNFVIEDNTEPVDAIAQQATSAEITSFLSTKGEKEMFDEFLKKRLVDEKRKLRAIPLREIKLMEENERSENMPDDEVGELPIEEDDYRDEESPYK